MIRGIIFKESVDETYEGNTPQKTRKSPPATKYILMAHHKTKDIFRKEGVFCFILILLEGDICGIIYYSIL